MIINLYLDSLTDYEEIFLNSFTKSFMMFMQAHDEDNIFPVVSGYRYPTDEEGEAIIKTVRKAYKSYLDFHSFEYTGVSLSLEEAEQYSRRLNVSILDTARDQDEGGRSWIIFCSTGQVINQ